MQRGIIYPVFIKERSYKKHNGFSLINALSILMIALVFMVFGLKIFINNLNHASVLLVNNEIVIDELYKNELKEITLKLNDLPNIKQVMEENFVLESLPAYKLAYFKASDKFVLMIYKENGDVKEYTFDYKLQEFCTCSKGQCYFKIKGEQIVLYERV